MSDTELKPCPFCGCPESNLKDLKKGYLFERICSNCGGSAIGVNSSGADQAWSTRAKCHDNCVGKEEAVKQIKLEVLDTAKNKLILQHRMMRESMEYVDKQLSDVIEHMFEANLDVIHKIINRIQSENNQLKSQIGEGE